MAEQFSMPSMFDTRYAMDRQMELDAQKAGQVGGGGKRYGMYYNSSLLGDRDNASLMSLTGMLGGQGDPRIAKQNAIDTIMQQFPNPESAEDFKAIANALNAQGLYDESARAMSMANDITASTPTRTKTKAADGFYRWDDTGEKVFTNAKLPEETDPDKLAFSLWRKTDAYLLAEDKSKAITDWQESRKTKTGNNDNYASQITQIMASVNGDTTIGGDLYDPQFPNGRNFTRLEAETKFEENKRKTPDQELDVIKRTANFEYANEMVDSTYEAANTAYKDIESMENILQSFEQGAKTGKLEQSLNTMKGVLRTLGADIDVNELMSQEILLAEFEKLALGRMQFLSGSASDNDIKFVKGGGPSFDKTPEANMLLIQQAMELSKEAQNKALFVRGYVSNYTKNNKGKSPAQWELTSAVEAFKNRGDYSDAAQAKYGDIWTSANFVAAGGSREQLINNYGLNQLNTWERYDKVVAGDITTGMATEKYISNKAKARALLEGEN